MRDLDSCVFREGDLDESGKCLKCNPKMPPTPGCDGIICQRKRAERREYLANGRAFRGGYLQLKLFPGPTK